ncbi:MAG: phage baseplate plug family protein [Spirochaetota bacterium]
MAEPRRIPFPELPAWRQNVRLEGKSYALRARYNTRNERWTLIVETKNGSLITTSLLTLYTDVLRGVTHEERPPGSLVVVSLSSTPRDPRRYDFEQGMASLIYVPSDYEPEDS